MPKVSVIIPVYNVEEYLPKCLDSVINQTLKDIEIICIDDGSTDNSLEILKAYAQKDPRMKVLTQKNQGPSVARNIGIEIANSDYIGFMDSDDSVDSDFYKLLYDKTTAADFDIVKGEMVKESSNKEYKTGLNKKILRNKYYFNGEFTSAIYKKQFLKINDIQFPKNITVGEDPIFSIKCMLLTDNIALVNKTYYHYQVREHSNSQTLSETKIDSLLESIRQIILMLNSSDIPHKYYCYIINKFSYKQILLRADLSGLNKEETINILIKLKKDIEPILKYYIKDVSNADVELWYNIYHKITKQVSDNELEQFCSGFKQKVLMSDFKNRKYLRYLFENKNNIEEYEDIKFVPKFAMIFGSAMWKPQPETIRYAIENEIPLLRIEDGFLRSADTWCNNTVDRKYTNAVAFLFTNDVFYFDATQSSFMERQINNPKFKLSLEQENRVRGAINRIVENHLTKYNHQPIYEPKIGRKGVKKVLVVDQSYGDFSIKKGLADDDTFKEMLDSAIKENPGADIIIKTHPDAMAPGTSRATGYYSTLKPHDNIYLLRKPINPISLLKYVDKVYVCTTQFGFEALMCGKEVHTFGMPFYAGWGLTIDKLKCPRRTATRTLEEIFYIAYIKNSHYIDPQNKCECSIERAIEYLINLRNEYKKYKKNIKIKNFVQTIFSIKNTDSHKILTIAGIKLKIKSKKLVYKTKIVKLKKQIKKLKLKADVFET